MHTPHPADSPAAYLWRSFSAVDGLWFAKVEEQLGFEAALALDRTVWEVMPKIQARKLKALADVGDGIDALFECFTTKLSIENYEFTAGRDIDGNGFEITVSRCPWQELLAKSGRGHLGETIGTRICNTEYRAWAADFGDDITFDLEDQMCQGSGSCSLRFSRPAVNEGE